MLDGQEITQFTYFQQVGGLDLAPVSAELTYGLERIAMFLQKVDNVFDLEWGNGVKYRDVRLREEIEQSRYAFNRDTNIEPAAFGAFHRDQFDKYFTFGERLLKAGLLLPALEHCLRCSHLFNVLDASGSIGVSERTAYVLRVRQLAVAICKQYAAEEETAMATEHAADET
jgi:glycyl-tRNA synthetase alpha chain